MLILTRRPNETIVIGGTIRVTVLGVKGNQIRLGLEAPAGISIDREEIFEAKLAEKGGHVFKPNSHGTLCLECGGAPDTDAHRVEGPR